jgi:hypothetical protein
MKFTKKDAQENYTVSNYQDGDKIDLACTSGGCSLNVTDQTATISKCEECEKKF